MVVQKQILRLYMYMAEILNLQVKVPARLEYIPLDKYQRYMQVVNNFEKGEDGSGEFLNLKAMEIFCDLKLSETYKLPMSSFKGILDQLSLCMSEETPLVKRFSIKGTDGAVIEFGFHPNLKDMSFGEYVDLDTYISDWKTINKAMAVLYRPVIYSSKNMYRIEEYESSEKYADILRYMPTSIALGALVFFYRLGMKLAKRSLTSSLDQMKVGDISRVEKLSLEKNGVGISQFMLWLEVTSQNLTKLPENRFTSV